MAMAVYYEALETSKSYSLFAVHSKRLERISANGRTGFPCSYQSAEKLTQYQWNNINKLLFGVNTHKIVSAALVLIDVFGRVSDIWYCMLNFLCQIVKYHLCCMQKELVSREINKATLLSACIGYYSLFCKLNIKLWWMHQYLTLPAVRRCHLVDLWQPYHFFPGAPVLRGITAFLFF